MNDSGAAIQLSSILLFIVAFYFFWKNILIKTKDSAFLKIANWFH